MNTRTSMDIGPLTWIKGEVNIALERAGEALLQYAVDANSSVNRLDPSNSSNLNTALSQLHQAHGALSIIALNGVTQFTGAIEKLVAAVGNGSLQFSPTCAEVVQNAITAIREYLDQLVEGEPNQPLRLMPPYRALMEAQGIHNVAPSDLFYADISLNPPQRENEYPFKTQEKREMRLKAGRLGFERGLRKWLNNPGNPAGVREMHNSAAIIESTQQQAGARAFWWITVAYLDTLATGGIPVNDAAINLCQRIDAQIKKLLDGSRDVSEGLMRDTLYYVAISSERTDQISQVREAYHLTELVPSHATDAASEAVARNRAMLQTMRDILHSANIAWNQFCSGTPTALPTFHQYALQLVEQGKAFGHQDLSRLLASIGSVANMLRKNPLGNNDNLALEIATALLLAQNALERFDHVGAAFSNQVDLIGARLAALQRGESVAAIEAPQLDEVSRRAQERLLMNQVAHEISLNLGQAEQTLDSFFRDPGQESTRIELAGLTKTMKQIEGALIMLGEKVAVQALHVCCKHIEAFSRPDYQLNQSDFEFVAEKLSAIGFFIDALQHGPADFKDMFDKATSAGTEPPAEISSTAGVLAPDLKLSLGGKTEAARRPSALPPKEVLPTKQEVGQHAPLPPPPPSEQTSRLVEAGSEAIDAELLEIFLEEAREVLDTLSANLEQSLTDRHDREALTTIRRSMHTLKGSGRMVGLTALGDTAWEVEKVMNYWLQHDLPATPDLHSVVRQAHALFAGWVVQLEAGSGTQFDTAEQDALIKSCKRVLLSEGAKLDYGD